MSMAVLIVILLAGGLVTWQLERIDKDLPRWGALVTVVVAFIYLLVIAGGLPVEKYSVAPDPRNGASWLLHLKLDWIPRFGIAFELAMDGLSLLLLVLTLALGVIAIASSWSEIDFKPGLFQANLLWTLAGICGNGRNLCAMFA